MSYDCLMRLWGFSSQMAWENDCKRNSANFKFVFIFPRNMTLSSGCFHTPQLLNLIRIDFKSREQTIKDHNDEKTREENNILNEEQTIV